LNSLCSLLNTPDSRNHDEASVYSSGIISQGEYITSRVIGEGLSGETGLNGTGLLVFGSQEEGNRTISGHGFVSGNMSVKDLVQYGGRV
jgi:hypothetical protein